MARAKKTGSHFCRPRSKQEGDRTAASLIDELGRLQKQILTLAPLLAREKALKALIRSWAESAPAHESGCFDGTAFVAVVGAKTLEREISDMGALYQILGHVTFIQHCAFGLACVDELVPLNRHAEFLNSERTGARSVKVVPR